MIKELTEYQLEVLIDVIQKSVTILNHNIGNGASVTMIVRFPEYIHQEFLISNDSLKDIKNTIDRLETITQS